MKFFVDTADVAEIAELNDTGLLDGVTTNPSLVAKTGKDFVATVKDICKIVKGPVSAEVTATDHATMLAEGRKLAGIATNVAVKVPLTMGGREAERDCSSFFSAISFLRTSVKLASFSLMISLLATSSDPSEAIRRRVLLRNSNWNCFLKSSG